MMRQLGKIYEDRAAVWIQALGYKILARNLTFPWGEIDLLAEEKTREGLILVVIEVRKRGKASWVNPAESVSWQKRQRLNRAIQSALQMYQGRAKEVRIDLIAFHGESLRHYRDFISGQ